MIRIEKLNKYFYRHKRNQLHVINNTSLEFPDNGLVAILGNSGCGKTTLLNAIGGLDKFNSGKIYYDNKKITKRKFRKMDKIRNNHIGYVFQDYKLIDDMSVYDNVALSLKMSGVKDKEKIKERVNYVLEVLELYRYRKRPAAMLSGGERQRVGIARAIAKNPDIVICDEPTGNLDSKNSIEIMNIIKCISKERLVILVTHELELAKFYADRIIEVKDGSVVKDYKNEEVSELDYVLDNKIYLKDFKIQEHIKNDNVKVNFYADKDSDCEFNIVVKNGNVYIETNKQFNIENINSDSSYELIDDHYKKIDKSIYEKYQFKMENYKKKYSSIFNLFTMIKAGFNKVINYSLIKKLFVLCFVAAGGVITMALSMYFGINDIKDESFIGTHKSFVEVVEKKDLVGAYNYFSNVPETKFIVSGTDSSLVINLERYYQTYELRDYFKTSAIAFKSGIDTSELIAGEVTDNKYDIVVDKLMFDRVYSESSFNAANIRKAEDLVGSKIILNDEKTVLTITGVVSDTEPVFYIDPSIEMLILTQTGSNYGLDLDGMEIEDIDYVMDDIVLKKGRLPQNDYEIIVPISQKLEYPLNKKIDRKINGNKLLVVGYYDSKTINNIITSNNTYRYLYFEYNNSDSFYVFVDDKDEFINTYGESYLIKDTYLDSKNQYKKDVDSEVRSVTIAASIMVAITLFEIFFMVRSSFMSRVKEVGILRAIGVKKSDIYKLFSGEIIVITTIGGVVGIIGGYQLCDALSNISMLSSYFMVKPFIALYAAILMYVFNLVVGLIPVFMTVRKTPAQILSRKDV